MSETIKLYWGKKFTQSYIRTHGLFDRMVNYFVFILIIVSLIGKGAVVIYVLEVYQREVLPLQKLFFNDVHPYILFFWISILLDLYLYYRLTITTERTIDLRKSISVAKRDNKDLDVSRFYTNGAHTAVERAFTIATKYRQEEVLPFHLFITLLDVPDIRSLFRRLHIKYDVLTDMLAKQIKQHESHGNATPTIELSQSTRDTLIHAARIAYTERKKHIDEIALFRALFERAPLIQDLLYEFDVDKTKIQNTISWIRSRQDIVKSYQRERLHARLKPRSGIDRAMTGLETPYARTVTQDITEKALHGVLSPYIERDEIMKSIFQGLESQRRILVMGPAGVGKTAIIEGLASRMAAEDVPHFLQDKRLVQIDAARLVGGSKAHEVIDHLVRVFDELARAGNVVLVIENVHLLTGITTGTEESLDVLDALGSILNKTSVYVIATAEAPDYQRISRTWVLSQLFRIISIVEPDENETIRILASKTLLLESKYNVYFTYRAIVELYRLTSRFMPKQHLPKKAVNLLDEIAVAKKGIPKKLTTIDTPDVTEVVSKKIHIPLSDIGEGEREKLLHLEDIIHSKIVSQDAAVSAVARALRRARTKLKNDDRPIATFLFLGPTGVGKTALAKTVSEIYFGKSYHMTRLNMNEFQSDDSAAKLIGGVNETGALTRSLEDNPHGLLLLDEIEKANHDVLNIFLQLMDEGFITDGRGTRIDARNILFIATSNAGSQFIQDQLRTGTSVEKITTELTEKHLKEYFLPEFLNRFDDIIVFKTLSPKDMKIITKMAFDDIVAALEKNNGIHLKYDNEAVAYTAEKGYREEYGARELQRTIKNIIQDPLSKLLLTREARRRDTIYIRGKGVFSVHRATPL